MNAGRILVVEDQVIIAHAIGQTLSRMGYDVVGIVHSGEQAIQKAGELHPDLVLMDVVLKGGMDGIQAASQIQTRFGIPLIFVTAYSHTVLQRHATLFEPIHYLTKPIVDQDLQDTVELVLDSYHAGGGANSSGYQPSP